MSGSKILVTGGAGFIGGHLVDALVKEGHSVRILDSLIGQVHGGEPPYYLNPEAEFVRGDVCDQQIVARALDGVEVVYHEAAEVGVGQSMYEIARYVKTNDLGTAVLLEEMSRRPDQFKKLVVASSNTIYGEGALRCSECDAHVNTSYLRSAEKLASKQWEFECEACGGRMRPAGTTEDKPLNPTTVYAISKQDQELYCLTVGKAYRIPSVALRYFNVYGTRQTLSNPYTGVCAIFSSRLLNGQAPLIYEDGEQSRDFVHVSDIVRANLLALESDAANYESINVGTGRATSVVEIAKVIAAGLGKSIEPEVVGKYREGDIRHCVADISKARRLLGYEPKTDLETGMQELLDWVREQTPEDRTNTATTELNARGLVR